MTKKLPFYGLLTVSFFPLFNVKGVSILIIIFSLLSLIYLATDFLNRWKPDVKGFVLSSIPFSLYLFGMIYTNDIKEGLKALETGLPLLLFPLLYFIVLGKNFTLGRKEKDFLLKSFTVSGVVFIIIVLFYLYISGALNSLFDVEMFQKTTENRGKDIIRWTIENTPFIGEHPTYFGLISIFVVLLSAFRIYNRSYLNVLSCFVGILGVLISGSKMAILTMILTGILSLFFLIKSKRKLIIIFCCLLVSISFLFISVPMIKVRFAQVLNTNLEPPKDLRYNSTNVRIAIYQCSFSNIKKAPLIGNGTRGYIKGMKECYKHYNTDIFKRQGWYFNSHNQYLSFVLSNGIIGLFAFILWIGVFLKSSFLNNDKLFSLSITVFVLMFFTENLIERQTGNVLFSFLILLFYKHYIDIFASRKT